MRESHNRISPRVSQAMYWFSEKIQSIPPENAWDKIRDPKLSDAVKHMFGLEPEEIKEFLDIIKHQYQKRINYGMMHKSLHHGDMPRKHNPLDFE